MTEKTNQKQFRGRGWLVMMLFAVFASGLIWRAVHLQLFQHDFLQDHGDARYLRTVGILAHRGMITDRNGEPLAISTPVSSAWANPRELRQARSRWPELAKALGMKNEQFKALIEPRLKREFVYLKRHLDPETAERIVALEMPGVSLLQEDRRYYPASEVGAHIIGFTNVDDNGQEGIELAFNDWLKGRGGSKRVIKDRLGTIVENVESIRAPEPGKELVLSIDKRLQYLAYRELKAAVLANKARGGSVVILDAQTGEILAMVSQPSFNPNNRSRLKGEYYRNRSVTDVFEPGSTMKPFTIAAGLESGRYLPTTTVDTEPGFYSVGSHTVRDTHNYGRLDVTGVIRKSSNVGASKIALSMEPEEIWRVLDRVGYGRVTGSGLPGESPGYLNDYANWRQIEQATLAFGYGMSTTTLQLAQAYTVFATQGRLLPVSILRLSERPEGEQALSPKTATEVLAMLETVVESGTARRAQIPGYRVAGKTGTVHKSTTNGYAEDRYLSLFTGLVPVSNPRLLAVVMIDEPRGGAYYGGTVAAPVFSGMMRDALRLLDIPPDNLPQTDPVPSAILAEHPAAEHPAAKPQPGGP